MNVAGFEGWLSGVAQEVGAFSAACVRLDNLQLRQRMAENSALYARWIGDGLHGEMGYLERMLPEKADLWSTFASAKSVIVLTFENRWGDPAATHPFPVPETGALLGYISAYAKEADYHHTGQQLLRELKTRLEQRLGHSVWAEASVDTKPVYERLLAIFGGLGIRGANDLLRVPGRKNVRVFVGCLFVDAELPEVIHEAKMPFACDDCQACIKNCPTGAIRFGEPIDARICISYLTIEKRSLLSKEEGAMIGDWLFGCDDCTVVCPPKDKVDTRIPVDLEWLLKTPAGELKRLIAGNATAYAGITQLRKNAVVILKKKGSPEAADLLRWVQENTGSELVRNQISYW